jgi:hypothetical protein
MSRSRDRLWKIASSARDLGLFSEIGTDAVFWARVHCRVDRKIKQQTKAFLRISRHYPHQSGSGFLASWKIQGAGLSLGQIEDHDPRTINIHVHHYLGYNHRVAGVGKGELFTSKFDVFFHRITKRVFVISKSR